MATYDKMRVIVCSSKNGDIEDVIFTEDLDVAAEDHCIPNKTTVDSDVVYDHFELPDGFPTEHTLRRD